MENFGKLASLIKDIQFMNAERSSTPISIPEASGFKDIAGNAIESKMIKESIIGVQSQFLWSVHSWDDGINKVI